MKNIIKKSYKYFLLITIILIVIFFAPKLNLNNENSLESSKTIVNYEEKKLPFNYIVEPDETEYSWVSEQGTGTKDDPYLITSNEDFVLFLNLLKASTLNTNNLKGIYFELVRDLDFEGEAVELVTHTNYFFGHFDGKGHVVKNLNGYYNGTTAASLFGRINGVVMNFGLVGGTFTVNTKHDMAATISSKLENDGVIYNVFSTANLDFTTTNTNSYPGGLVSSLDKGSIINCYYDGVITSPRITKSYGITRFEAKSVNIINSFTGTNSNVSVSYEVTPGKTPLTSSKFTDSPLEFLDVTSNNTLNKLNDYIAKNYLTKYYYKFSEDNTYITFTDESLFILEGEGTIDEPFLINSNEDFLNFRKLNDEGFDFNGLYIYQTDNLDFTDEDMLEGLDQTKIFKGIYDGGGHYIKNIELNCNYSSLFGSITNGSLKNFGLLGGNAYFVGGRFEGTIAVQAENSIIQNVFSTMDIYVRNPEYYNASGLLGGFASTGSLSNAYYGGHVYFDEEYDHSNSPFLGIMLIIKYYSTYKEITAENIFWPNDIEYGITDDRANSFNLTRDMSYVLGENRESMSRDEMSSDTLIDRLNTYSIENDLGCYWMMEDGIDYPVLTEIIPSEFELLENEITIFKDEKYKVNYTSDAKGLQLVFERDNDYVLTTKNQITGLETGRTILKVYPKTNSSLVRELVVNIEPSIILSDTLEVNELEEKIVIGAEPNTSIDNFLDNLLNNKKYLKIYDLADNLISDYSNEIIKTGYKVRLINNYNIFDEALIIIRGDINKDGDVNISDSIMLGDHVLRKEEIDDYRLYASELYFDDLINVSDNVRLGDYILRKIESLNK